MGETNNSANVIALATAQLSAKDRARIERRDQELAAGKIEIRSRYDALKWGDGWQQQAMRTQAQLERTQMLLYCAEAHCKASELLFEHAQAELERLRAITA